MDFRFPNNPVVLFHNQYLSYDVASGNEITPSNKMDKPLEWKYPVPKSPC